MENQTSARYLLINPNTNGLTTQRLQEVLLPQLPKHASLVVATASFGANYIACEASHAIAAHACIQTWAEHLEANTAPLDGVLIGCFGDPGLFALREMSGCPVTGLADKALMHIETVVPSGAELQANPQMAIECLKTACQNASLNGVKSIILGGAGLAGYAAQIQSMVDLPIIDSATAGLEVLLNEQAPKATLPNNGTFAAWTAMPKAIQNLRKR